MDLATDYCRETSVEFKQFTGLAHVGRLVASIPDALAWVSQQFARAGRPRADRCASLLAESR